MATIVSLPPETLARILKLAAEQDGFRFAEIRAALGRLAAASLVARRWKEPAQTVMWCCVEISSEGEAKRMVASPACGTYRTSRVELSACALEKDGVTISDVFEKLRGVESLNLFEEPVSEAWDDVTWLAHGSLRDLITLEIHSKYTDVIPPNLLPSFRLQNLVLGGRASSAALTHTLLASSATSLVSLELEAEEPLGTSALLASVPSSPNPSLPSSSNCQ